jgi:hypothetical protein
MKPLLYPFAMFCLLAAATQVTAADPQSSFGLAPAAPPPLQPAPAAPPNIGLMPDAPQSVDKPEWSTGPSVAGAKLDKAKSNQTLLEDDKLRKKIQFRKAMTKALRDPGLQAVLTKTYTAKTDFEYRKWSIEYYNGLYDLVEKIDKTLDHDETEALRKASTNRFLESRIQGAVDPNTFRKNPIP